MNAVVNFSCNPAGLLSVDDTLVLLLARLAPVAQTESVTLSHAAGRILAESLMARLTVPPCDRSAMDGYAFRFTDGNKLRMTGTARAGAPYDGQTGAGECIAITTGAALPTDCDTVAMREHCEVTQTDVIVRAKGQGANIRRRGEDFHAGREILSPGTRIGARHLALLAAAGVETVMVRRPLAIAILSMGDELNGSAPDSIRDANRPMLQTLCADNGFKVTDLGILPDKRAKIAAVLANAAATHDVIITSAGTAAGDEDHFLGALLDCGGLPLSAGAAIKPGKPVSFGQIGNSLCMALPGNPVAAYITFLVLGMPLLRRLSGGAKPSIPWRCVVAGFSHHKKSGLREYLRVRLAQGADGELYAKRCGSDGSAMLASMAASDGLVRLEEHATDIREGDPLPFATFAELENT